MSPVHSGSPSGFKVVRTLVGDAKIEAVVAKVPGLDLLQVIRVLRPGSGVDADSFVDRARALGELCHSAVRVVRGWGRLPDGRPYFFTDLNDTQTLNKAGILAVEELVELGTQLAQGLVALHGAGLSTAGLLTAEDVALGPPATLDAWQAALGLADAEPTADVRALADALLAHANAESERGTFDAKVRQTLQAARTAEGLAQALEQLERGWRSRTAISGSGPAAGNTSLEADLTGTALGPWQLERLLGEGAMGRVYLGRHQRIGRQSAVKVLKQEHARNGDLVQRFIQEATAVNAIKSEHIVEISDFGEQPQEDGSTRVYCVMELLLGRSLAEAMSEGPFTIQRAAKVGRSIAFALNDAHQVGVVHRDIKPDNVFLHRRGSDSEYVKVLDFGVAKLLKPLGDMPKSGTQAGIVIGTPDYMAPEQALGAPTDFRIDLYSLGIVLYQLLSGHRPFEAGTFGQLLIELTTKPVPPLAAKTPLGETIPGPLRQAVERCLQREPARRFESAQALAEALEPYAHSGHTGTFPALPEATRPLRGARTKVVVGAGIAALVALLLVGAWLFGGRSKEVGSSRGERAAAERSGGGELREKSADRTVWLEVRSTPPGATVRHGDALTVLGTTPFKLKLPARTVLPLRIEAEGYVTEARTVPFSVGAAIQVDLDKSHKPARRGEVKKR